MPTFQQTKEWLLTNKFNRADGLALTFIGISLGTGSFVPLIFAAPFIYLSFKG